MGEGQKYQRQAHNSLLLFLQARKERESCVLTFKTYGPCPSTRFLYFPIVKKSATKNIHSLIFKGLTFLCRYTPLVQIELLKMHSSICMDDFSAE